jgi:monofunctional biosynthetic peptidoglycan transglycosylase
VSAALKRRASLPWRIVRGLGWLLAGALMCALALVVALRWINPPTSAFMLGTRLTALASGDHSYATHYQWVDLEHISAQAALAVIAAEDQQFPFHAGFDFKSIREAVRHNAEGRRVHGASTISQQVAKNLFLWSGQSYFRKALEAGLTVLIEYCWPKERILEVYLNVAEFGRGIYGVQAAAQHFFHEDARYLDRADSALLAAVLPNPRRYRVDAPSRFVLARRAWIAQQMADLGGTGYLNRLEAEAHRRP